MKGGDASSSRPVADLSPPPTGPAPGSAVNAATNDPAWQVGDRIEFFIEPPAADCSEVVAEALREAASRWLPFVSDQGCPTCSMPPSRETTGMVCQTCGTDYGRARR